MRLPASCVFPTVPQYPCGMQIGHSVRFPRRSPWQTRGTSETASVWQPPSVSVARELRPVKCAWEWGPGPLYTSLLAAHMESGGGLLCVLPPAQSPSAKGHGPHSESSPLTHPAIHYVREKFSTPPQPSL